MITIYIINVLDHKLSQTVYHVTLHLRYIITITFNLQLYSGRQTLYIFLSNYTYNDADLREMLLQK